MPKIEIEDETYKRLCELSAAPEKAANAIIKGFLGAKVPVPENTGGISDLPASSPEICNALVDTYRLKHTKNS